MHALSAPSCSFSRKIKSGIRRLGGATLAAGIALVVTGCPEERQTINQLRAHSAQLDKEMQVALKRKDLTEFWRLNREQMEIREALQAYNPAAGAPEMGMVLARFPDSAVARSLQSGTHAPPTAPAAAAMPSIPSGVHTHSH